MNFDLLRHLPLLLKRRRLIPKLLRNYKKLLIDKRPVLRTVDFSVTFVCTCECEHCYIQPLVDHTRTALDLEEKKRVIRELLELGAVAINFVGGEPLCDPDLEQLIASIPPSEGVAVVTTNGVLLDEALLDRLIEAGLGILCVSLDEPDAAAHDAFRRRAGTFDQAMRAIVAAEQRGLECVINSVITEEKLLDGRAARLVEMAREQHAKINLALPVPVGRWAKRGIERLSPAADAEMARLRRLSHVRWDGQSNYLKPGCGAGVEKLAITAYGDVLPCGGIQLTFGNVRDKPLRDIWRDMLAYPQFSHLTDRCPLSEDPDFIRRYLDPIERCEMPKPLPAEMVLGPRGDAPADHE